MNTIATGSNMTLYSCFIKSFLAPELRAIDAPASNTDECNHAKNDLLGFLHHYEVISSEIEVR